MLSATFALTAVSGVLAQDGLRAGFVDPPQKAHPRVWWHWVSGNVTEAGTTADFEWMKRTGHVRLPAPLDGTGPMQGLWGDKKPNNYAIEDTGKAPTWYRDTVVVAYRKPKAQALPRPEVRSDLVGLDVATLMDGDVNTSAKLVPAKDAKESEIELRFAEPVSLETVTLWFGTRWTSGECAVAFAGWCLGGKRRWQALAHAGGVAGCGRSLAGETAGADVFVSADDSEVFSVTAECEGIAGWPAGVGGD